MTWVTKVGNAGENQAFWADPLVGSSPLFDTAPTGGIVKFTAGQRILSQGDRAKNIYLLVLGRVRVEVGDLEGHRHVVSFLYPGDIVFVGLSEHWGSVIALSDCELRCWNLVGGPALGSEKVAVLMKVLDQQHCDFALRILKLGKHSARERLWSLMLWMAERGDDASGQFHVPPRSDIADFLGLAPETVSRLWQSYRDEGLVTRLGSQRWRFCPPQAGGNDRGGGAEKRERLCVQERK